jgi:hypothetical protein
VYEHFAMHTAFYILICWIIEAINPKNEIRFFHIIFAKKKKIVVIPNPPRLSVLAVCVFESSSKTVENRSRLLYCERKIKTKLEKAHKKRLICATSLLFFFEFHILQCYVNANAKSTLMFIANYIASMIGMRWASHSTHSV